MALAIPVHWAGGIDGARYTGVGALMHGAHYQYTGLGALMVFTTSTLGWKH